MALVSFHAFIEIPLMPAPDRRLLRARAAHDLSDAMPIRHRQKDLSPPDQSVRRVAVGDQGLKLSQVDEAKVRADVTGSHTRNRVHQTAIGSHVSGGEH